MLFFKSPVPVAVASVEVSEFQERSAMTRRNLCVLALAIVASVPMAAFAQTDVSGDWLVTIESPQGPATVDLSMKQAGEALTGTVTSPMGSVDFKGKVLKDALNVSYTMNVQGNSIEITMTGTVAGDAIAGNLDFGGLGQVPWTAKRKTASAAPASRAASAAPSPAPAAAGAGEISGKWDITFNMGGNQMPASATFTQAGDKVTGTITSLAGGVQVSGTMTGKTLKLEFNIPTQQGDIPVTMTGDLGPDGLAGKASLAGMGDADWTGKRVN
jgi:hypothetical protein